MLLTNMLEASPRGGRALLSKLNHDVLRDIYGDALSVVELSRAPVRTLASDIRALRGHIDGLSTATIRRVISHITLANIAEVFIDGSNLGEAARQIKQACPRVRIYTFFHNVETRFFLGSLQQRKSPRALAVLAANYLAEKKSVRFSDRLIVLSDRDSSLLRKIYGRAATDISPMAVLEQPPGGSGVPSHVEGKFALFVGGGFYANEAGIAWYARHVAPRIALKTYVIGRGLAGVKQKLHLCSNVEVIGEVVSVADWYRAAYFCVAPIFDGSGMKTKIAEALMFGKRVLGTPEAFSGYEEIAARIGRICSSADDFVEAIASADTLVRCPFDPELRSIYEARYSYSAAKARLQAIMKAPLG